MHKSKLRSFLKKRVLRHLLDQKDCAPHADARLFLLHKARLLVVICIIARIVQTYSIDKIDSSTRADLLALCRREIVKADIEKEDKALTDQSSGKNTLRLGPYSKVLIVDFHRVIDDEAAVICSCFANMDICSAEVREAMSPSRMPSEGTTDVTPEFHKNLKQSAFIRSTRFVRIDESVDGALENLCEYLEFVLSSLGTNDKDREVSTRKIELDILEVCL